MKIKLGTVSCHLTIHLSILSLVKPLPSFIPTTKSWNDLGSKPQIACLLSTFSIMNNRETSGRQEHLPPSALSALPVAAGLSWAAFALHSGHPVLSCPSGLRVALVCLKTNLQFAPTAREGGEAAGEFKWESCISQLAHRNRCWSCQDKHTPTGSVIEPFFLCWINPLFLICGSLYLVNDAAE